MVPKKYFKISLKLILYTLILSYGVMIGKYKIFPYKTFSGLKKVFSSELDGISEIEKIQNSAHNSFKIKTYNFWNSSKLVGHGGALTKFRNYIVGVDKEGHFFKFDNNEIELIEDIYIKTNENDVYNDMIDSGITEFAISKSFKYFRFLDLQSFDSKNLLVSYQFYDKINKQKYFKVVKIEFEEKELIPKNYSEIYTSRFPIKFSSDIQSPFFSNRNGGKIIKFDDENILFALGDNQYDDLYYKETSSQNYNSDFGKIIKININNLSRTFYATGLRNPQGLIKNSNSKIFELEHGPQGGDELNLIKEGENYGWPNVTLGVDYGKSKWPLQDSIGRHLNFTKPIYSWIPSIAPSNLVEIKNIKNWTNDLIIGTLKEESLYRVRIERNMVLFAEKIFIGERIRDLEEKNDKLILWTDNARIITLELDNIEEKQLEFTEFQKKIQLDKVLNECIVCHQNNTLKNENKLPSLSNIINNNIASSGYKFYSKSLREKSLEKWNLENLNHFLRDPDKFAPGTSMINYKIENDTLRNELINYINDL